MLFFSDDLLNFRDFILAGGKRFIKAALQFVRVGQFHMGDVAGEGIDVAGNGDVQQDEGAHPISHRPRKHRPREDGCGRTGCADDHIGLGDGLLQVGKGAMGNVMFGGKGGGAAVGAIGDRDVLHAASFQSFECQSPHFAQPNDEELFVA